MLCGRLEKSRFFLIMFDVKWYSSFVFRVFGNINREVRDFYVVRIEVFRLGY